MFSNRFKVDEDIPIWEGIEVLSFGKVSKMYANWRNGKIKNKIKKELKIFDDYKKSVSIIRSIVRLRNLCAHHTRIWNTKGEYQIPKPRSIKIESSHDRSHWRVICILMALVEKIKPDIGYSTRVIELCKKNTEFFKGLTYPIYIRRNKMCTNAKI